MSPLASPHAASDDGEMIRVAARLTRDLMPARPAVYWADLLASAGVGYAALAGAVMAPGTGARLACGAAAVLALYRALSFIHELTHLKPGGVPGFRTGWNVLVGVPLMAPSFLYEGVHALHHARPCYGTGDDPEYLPLSTQTPAAWPCSSPPPQRPPSACGCASGVLAPLSATSPPLRRWVEARASALSINPAFRRKPPQGAALRDGRAWEAATCAWALAAVALTVAGVVPLRAAATWLAVSAVVAVLNQVRTLAAHLWESEGEPASVTAQYLDSVNVPPPAWLPALWAPVGLRYHAPAPPAARPALPRARRGAPAPQRRPARRLALPPREPSGAVGAPDRLGGLGAWRGAGGCGARR